MPEGGDGAKVVLTYTVGGFLDGGLDRVVAPIDRVLGEQLGRLKRFVESGSAEIPGGNEGDG